MSVSRPSQPCKFREVRRLHWINAFFKPGHLDCTHRHVECTQMHRHVDIYPLILTQRHSLTRFMEVSESDCTRTKSSAGHDEMSSVCSRGKQSVGEATTFVRLEDPRNSNVWRSGGERRMSSATNGSFIEGLHVTLIVYEQDVSRQQRNGYTCTCLE